MTSDTGRKRDKKTEKQKTREIGEEPRESAGIGAQGRKRKWSVVLKANEKSKKSIEILPSDLPNRGHL